MTDTLIRIGIPALTEERRKDLSETSEKRSRRSKN